MRESTARKHEAGISASPPVAGGPALRPLVVDLDGSLVKGDRLWEAVVQLVRERPWHFLYCLLWVVRGPAHFKQRVAQALSLSVSSLTYHEEVLRRIRTHHAAGGEVVLATAADERIAQAVADDVGLFSQVLASDGRINLSGRHKLEAIERALNGRAFDYIGDSAQDVPIWTAATRALVVEPSPRLARRLRQVRLTEPLGESRAGQFKACLAAMRVHQWVKNTLVFVPLLLAHQIFSPAGIASALAAFFVFSFAASSIYLFNDILDLDADRRHPQKRFRPLAAGHMSIPQAVVLAGGLLLSAVGIASWVLPTATVAMTLVYVAATMLYSFRLKRMPVIDVVVLAGFYAYRVLFGGVATGCAISPWLLVFSMFFFLGLAMIKRYSDLVRGAVEGNQRAAGRAYEAGDVDLFRSLGAAASYMSVLVTALYIHSDEVRQLYAWPELLWLVCPVLLYWNTRVWWIAHRGQMPYDPIVFAMRDRVSYVAGACIVGFVAMAALGGSIGFP